MGNEGEDVGRRFRKVYQQLGWEVKSVQIDKVLCACPLLDAFYVSLDPGQLSPPWGSLSELLAPCNLVPLTYIATLALTIAFLWHFVSTCHHCTVLVWRTSMVLIMSCNEQWVRPWEMLTRYFLKGNRYRQEVSRLLVKWLQEEPVKNRLIDSWNGRGLDYHLITPLPGNHGRSKMSGDPTLLILGQLLP